MDEEKLAEVPAEELDVELTPEMEAELTNNKGDDEESEVKEEE